MIVPHLSERAVLPQFWFTAAENPPHQEIQNRRKALTPKGNTMFKSITLAAIVASAATVASADTSYIFDLNTNREAASTVDLDTIRATSDGVVEIYNFHAGEQGALLGTENVFAGANSDVRVQIGAASNDDLLAVLKVNGQVADTFHIDVK